MIEKIKSLKKNQGFMKYFKNTNWIFIDKFIRMTTSLFIGIYVARYLGPSDFGLLSYAIVLISFLIPFWRLGLNPVVNKRIINNEDNENNIIGSSLIIQIVMYFIVFLLFIIFAYSSDFYKNKEFLIVLIIFLGTIFSTSDIFEQYFNAKVKSKYNSYSSIVATISSGCLKILFIFLNLNLIYFAIIFVIEYFIKAVILIYFINLHSTLKINFFKFDSTIARKLLYESWPFILTGVMTGLYMKIDQVMIKYFIDNEAVGLYAVSVRLSEVWFIIPMILTQSLFPAILNGKKKSEELFESRIIALYSVLIYTALFISLIMMFISEDLVLFLFGSEYIGSIHILQIYVWSIVFIFLNNGQWMWYRANDLQKLAMYRLIVGAILNIFLNIIFLNLYGLIGAAYATFITYAYVGFIGNIFHNKLRRNFILQCKAILFVKIRN